MSKSIIVSLPHTLGVAEARRVVAERLDFVRKTYLDKLAHSEVAWTGDRADLRVVALGQQATGQIDVTAEAVRIEVLLPWVLASLAGKVEGLIRSNAAETLRLGAPPKKA